MRSLLALIFIALTSSISIGQSIGEWTAYNSHREVRGIIRTASNTIWTITAGGVAIYNDSELQKTLSTTDGLTRLDGTSIGYDSIYNNVYVGYLSGEVDVINVETYEVMNINDISRNASFTSKSINDILTTPTAIFLATDFGIVEFDPQTMFVRDSYTKLGSMNRGIIVNDISITNDTLYAATQEGVALTPNDGTILSTDWTVYNANNGLVSDAFFAIDSWNGSIYASTSSQNYKYSSNNWAINPEFSNNVIISYQNYNNDVFSALAPKNIYVNDGTSFSVRFLGAETGSILANLNELDATLYFGSLNQGLALLSLLNFDVSYITPAGPYQNQFQGLRFDGNTLISGSTQKSSGSEIIDRGKGYFIYDGVWENYTGDDTEALMTTGYRQALTTTVTNEYYYFGSWGRGVARHNKSTDEIKVFDETNSTLRGWPLDNPLFPVISGLDVDSENRVWLVSRYGDTPLYQQNPGDEDWISFNKDLSASAADLYESLFIDSFDQKWIPTQSSSSAGTGLLILDTGLPNDDSDDRGIKLTTGVNSGNLPDLKVKAIVQDLNNEVWIGTERGLARFLFPEFIVDGGVNERRAQWLINEDTSTVSRFLLRDVNVSSMAVNAANEKWIGSVNQGIWVLNANGSAIIHRFTVENSPLYSNNIISIAVKNETGEVFIATDQGLISYTDIPRASVTKMKDLKVYPNPFSYDRYQSITIDGLSKESTIRIVAVDGTVVHSFTTAGGRTSWDGYDYSGNKLGSGVYFVVALDSNGSSKGLGKVVVVR